MATRKPPETTPRVSEQHFAAGDFQEIPLRRCLTTLCQVLLPQRVSHLRGQPGECQQRSAANHIRRPHAQPSIVAIPEVTAVERDGLLGDAADFVERAALADTVPRADVFQLRHDFAELLNQILSHQPGVGIWSVF